MRTSPSSGRCGPKIMSHIVGAGPRWKGFFENRETITLEQMKASRAVVGQPDECIEKVATLLERFGVTYLCFEVNFGALPHVKVVQSLERFAATVMKHFS